MHERTAASRLMSRAAYRRVLPAVLSYNPAYNHDTSAAASVSAGERDEMPAVRQ